MKTRSIQYDDEIYDQLQVAAENRGVSVNWLVNKILEESMIRLKDPDQFTVLL